MFIHHGKRLNYNDLLPRVSRVALDKLDSGESGDSSSTTLVVCFVIVSN